MADKKLNELGTASDANYIYAEASNGMQVRISKADLASVVAQQLGRAGSQSVNPDTILDTSYMVVAQASTPYPNAYGHLRTTRSNTQDGYSKRVFQEFVSLEGDKEFVRVFNGTSWSAWQQIGFGVSSPAELASVVAEQNLFYSGRVSASGDFIDLAKAVIEAIPIGNTTFSFVVDSNIRRMAIGYIYPNKLFGMVIFFDYTKTKDFVKVVLYNGVYEQV